MYKVRIEPYGCSANMADAEIIAGLLKGYEIVNDEREADLNIIVTCTVKDATANRMVHRIKRLSKKPLIVAGCFAKAEPEKVKAINPRATLLSPDAIDESAAAVNETLNGIIKDRLAGSARKVNLPRVRLNPVVSIVEIASGCLSECTFCETRIAKGRLKSYRIGEIVRQVRDDVREGCREVWLTSTDNGAYGRDINTDLSKLIKEVCTIDGDFMIRVGMMNPLFVQFMLDDLIEAYKDEKVFKFLHIPLQSGSDRILSLMKRNHKASLFIDIIERFRKEIKDITIATDIIVGFPEESSKDFEETIKVLEMVKPDIVNISRYSMRPNTEASMMKRVDTRVMKERSKLLHQVVNKITLERNKRWLNWSGRVIIDEVKDGGVQGRNFAYKPIFIREEIPLGSIVNVRVTNASVHSLLGRKLILLDNL